MRTVNIDFTSFNVIDDFITSTSSSFHSGNHQRQYLLIISCNELSKFLLDITHLFNDITADLWSLEKRRTFLPTRKMSTKTTARNLINHNKAKPFLASLATNRRHIAHSWPAASSCKFSQFYFRYCRRPCCRWMFPSSWLIAFLIDKVAFSIGIHCYVWIFNQINCCVCWVNSSIFVDIQVLAI